MLMLGFSIATILLLISALHVYWVLGGQWGLEASIPSNPKSGKPLFVPTPAAALVVAAALAIAAGLIVANFYGSSALIKPATWGMGSVFLLRALGDFHYVGMFKRTHGTRFAQLDSTLYTPLCLTLGIAAFLIARFA